MLPCDSYLTFFSINRLPPTQSLLFIVPLKLKRSKNPFQMIAAEAKLWLKLAVVDGTS
jgi:hypothetical protein